MSTPSPTGSYTGSYTAGALAYHELKNLILLGDVPIGLRLREERIAERLGVSRTPVREALLRLHAERFLDRHPEGGFRVLNPSVQTMRDLYEIRRALELFALRRTAGSRGHDRDALEQLRDEWRGIDTDSAALDPEFVLLDEDFHGRLAESAGNQQLADELRQLSERIRPVRTHDFITPGRIASTIEQHLAILDAVIARRNAKAAQLLDAHIQQSQGVVEVAVARMLERMLSIGERDVSW
ncbi:MAG: transcriptional regulator, GntR family [Acidimicrobiaceae bacterium]|nr:transcriptional regulator, GntR family [Acidimicrobiaceae bacterium]